MPREGCEMRHRAGQTSTGAAHALPSPFVGPLADNSRLISMICEILDLPAHDVRTLLRTEELSLGAQQRSDADRLGLRPGQWTPELVEFYRDTRMGLVGNPVWNRRTAKIRMREWIGRYLSKAHRPSLDILTVGDGSGFDSLYLSQCGHRVTYSETSSSARDFAQRMFADEDASIRVVDDFANEPDDSQDVIVCLDVLEHVPDPPAFVEALVRRLRPGGALIVHAPFFFVGPLNPTHLETNRTYSGDLGRLYEKNGLRLVEGRPWWDPIVLTKSGTAIVRESRLKAALLSFTGLLLALARWWNWPHCLVAARLMQQHEPRWLRGLEETG